VSFVRAAPERHRPALRIEQQRDIFRTVLDRVTVGRAGRNPVFAPERIKMEWRV
jgi:hypothetical protein